MPNGLHIYLQQVFMEIIMENGLMKIQNYYQIQKKVKLDLKLKKMERISKRLSSTNF